MWVFLVCVCVGGGIGGREGGSSCGALDGRPALPLCLVFVSFIKN